MFNSVTDDPKNELLRDRLSRLADDIRQLELSTREEYQAELYSRVNAILAEGVEMTPLIPITAEGPAILGDLTRNLSLLNRDGADVAGQILRIEDIASRLYNLAASSQNSLRQQIRELALSSNQKRYLEPFINVSNLGDFNGSIDQNAGVASLPLITDTELDLTQATISIGNNSEGTQQSEVDTLTDGRIDTIFSWNGTKLELIVRFKQPEIINRLKIEMDDYQGLEVTVLETSPDGTLVENILGDLGVTSLELNGIQSKYSGDFILDFPPRHCSSLRLVLEDRVDVALIALRALSVFSRRYSNAGFIITKPITAPTGTVRFSTIEKTVAPLTSITHQLSYNGVHFSVIQPGQEIILTSTPYWYRAVFERSTTRFDDADAPIEGINSDPLANTNFVLGSSHSVPVGDGIMERTLFFQEITGPIKFRETPLPNTLQIQEGSVLLEPSEYAFNGGILSFEDDRGSITVTYQTSQLGAASIKQRQEYYSPLLYEARFEKV
jgi:hypothetical protein